MKCLLTMTVMPGFYADMGTPTGSARFDGSCLARGCVPRSPKATAILLSASSLTFAAKSKLGAAEQPASAASPIIAPARKAWRNALPPGGRRRTSTKRNGLATSACSGFQQPMTASPLDRLASHMVTIGNRESMSDTEGCSTTRTARSCAHDRCGISSGDVAAGAA